SPARTTSALPRSPWEWKPRSKRTESPVRSIPRSSRISCQSRPDSASSPCSLPNQTLLSRSPSVSSFFIAPFELSSICISGRIATPVADLSPLIIRNLSWTHQLHLLVLRAGRLFAFIPLCAAYPPTTSPPHFLLLPPPRSSLTLPLCFSTALYHHPYSLWLFFIDTIFLPRNNSSRSYCLPANSFGRPGELTSAGELAGRWGSALWPSCRALPCSALIHSAKTGVTGCAPILRLPSTVPRAASLSATFLRLLCPAPAFAPDLSRLVPLSARARPYPQQGPSARARWSAFVNFWGNGPPKHGTPPQSPPRGLPRFSLALPSPFL